jgi:tRNA modification GTPase
MKVFCREEEVMVSSIPQNEINDTIAAISTAWGEAGIAIVRLSGAESRKIADGLLSLAVPLSETEPRLMRNGFLLDEKGEALDQILAVWFAPPRSYTGEEVVEIHTHGGALVARKCLDLLLCGGARQADPGEFTRRAFLSGRIDLTQAEAVLGIIRSRSDEALRAAARTLKGELALFARDIYEEVKTLSGEMEVSLDFFEDDSSLEGDEGAALLSLQTLIQSLQDLMDRCSTGLLLREGIRVAIVGQPNVGKSSLLNALLRESRAIVTAIPGTTRDLIEEVLTYRGIPIRLIDTAGLGKPSDEAEAAGISRAETAFEEADIRIWVADGSIPPSDFEFSMAERIGKIPHVVAVNKSDLSPGRDERGKTTKEVLEELLPESPVISISALEEKGLVSLKDALVSSIAGGGVLDNGLNASARQVNEIRDAIANLKEAAAALETGPGHDAAAESLAGARGAMERLLGISKGEDLLNYIFSQFCVGK